MSQALFSLYRAESAKLAAAAPRLPYRHLELWGIALAVLNRTGSDVHGMVCPVCDIKEVRTRCITTAAAADGLRICLT